MSHTSRLHEQILDALLAGPEFGYPLAQTIKKRAPGLLDNQEALIYPALHELETDGDVTSHEQTVQNRPRRYYKLTERGIRRALKQNTRQESPSALQSLPPLLGEME